MTNVKKLGELVEWVDTRNRSGISTNLLGINIEKYFMPSVANIIGTDLSSYKLIFKNQFACNPMHVGRDEKMPIALYSDEKPSIVSPAYFVFQVKDVTILNPEFLMLWFRRIEFDRECWFHTDGSVRGGITWDEILEMSVPVPSIEAQNRIVLSYNDIEKRIKLKRQINDNLASSLQTTFSKLFVKEYTPNEWSKGHLKDILFLVHDHIKAEEVGGLPYLPIDTIPIKELIVNQYRDSSEALSSLIKYCKNDILIGAMRVYFHRVVIAPCDGVTRTTCFVLRPYQEEYLYYALCLCNQPSSIQYANSTSKGSTMPYAVWEDGFSELEILIPPIDDLRQFNNMAKNIIEIMYKNVEEINKLKSLLPLLQTRLSR